MQKKIIYPILAIVIIILIILLFRKCDKPDLELVTVDTIIIKKIDTLYTEDYIILTTTIDTILKRINKPRQSSTENKANEIDEAEDDKNHSEGREDHSESGNSKKDSNKSDEKNSRNSKDDKNADSHSETRTDDTKNNTEELADESTTEQKENEQRSRNPINEENTLIDTVFETTTSVIVDSFYNVRELNDDDEAILINEYTNPKEVGNYRRADEIADKSTIPKMTIKQIKELSRVVIPIKFHDVLRNDGNGNKTYPDHFEILVELTLNNLFEDAGIEFVQCGEINYIKNSELYSFPKLDFAGEKYNFNYLENIMDMYNVPNVLNIYLVNSMSGVGGLYPGQESEKHPESMLVITKEYLMHGIPEHEIGHWLFLRHTHYSDDNKKSAELVDQSNCKTAGDKFCDTKADPNLTERVSDDCRYIKNSSLKDAKGKEYNPDVKNIMSYTKAICKKDFTEEQLKMMATQIRGTLRNSISLANCGININPNPEEQNSPEEIKFSDVSITDIQIVNRIDEKYDITLKVTNEGNIATPGNEEVKIVYDVNGRKNDVAWMIPSLAPGKNLNKTLSTTVNPKDTIIVVELEVSKLSNEENLSNNKLGRVVRVKTNPIDPNKNNDPITLTNISKECPTSTQIDLRKIYQVELDFNESSGYWLSFYVPQGKMVKTIRLFDVSSNFDPVIGVKSNCAYANFIPDDYFESSDNRINSNGLGKAETFYTDFYGVSKGNNGWYHIKISHAISNQSPKVSFKLQID
ncbi:MAG: M43 family zinc metalloprotease [Chitinophagales bacterium]